MSKKFLGSAPPPAVLSNAKNPGQKSAKFYSVGLLFCCFFFGGLVFWPSLFRREAKCPLSEGKRSLFPLQGRREAFLCRQKEKCPFFLQRRRQIPSLSREQGKPLLFSTREKQSAPSKEKRCPEVCSLFNSTEELLSSQEQWHVLSERFLQKSREASSLSSLRKAEQPLSSDEKGGFFSLQNTKEVSSSEEKSFPFSEEKRSLRVFNICNVMGKTFTKYFFPHDGLFRI